MGSCISALGVSFAKYSSTPKSTVLSIEHCLEMTDVRVLNCQYWLIRSIVAL